MVAPTYANVVQGLFTELDVLLNNFVFNGYSALASALKYPLGLAITLYVVMLGISISQGWVKLSMANLVKSTLKIGVLYTFAMNWGFFSEYAIKLISNGAGEIGSILLHATPISLPGGGSEINGAIQSVLIEFTELGHWVWGMGSFHNLSPYFTSIVTWGFGYALLLVSIFELALAKIMLAILFVTAPLFVGFTLFKPTHGFFDRWLGAIVGFALLMVFISAILALVLSVSQWAIAASYAKQARNFSLMSFVPVMIVGFLGVGILLKVSDLAQQIGGGVTTASASSLLAGTIGGAVGGTFVAMKMPMSMLDSASRLLRFGSNSDRNTSSKGGDTSSHHSKATVSSIQKNLRTQHENRDES